MTILLNDKPAEIPEDTSVASLLSSLGFAPARVAVERNGEIVPRAAYDHVLLREGDRLEIVQFVGGG